MEADPVQSCCVHAEENARLRRELARTRGELEGLRRALAEARVAGLDHEDAAAPRLEPRLMVAAGEPHPTDGRLARVHQGSSRRAKLALYQAGAGDPWPPEDGARELLALATERFKAAGDLVAAAQGAEEERKLAAERDRLASLLQALSTRLDDGR